MIKRIKPTEQMEDSDEYIFQFKDNWCRQKDMFPSEKNKSRTSVTVYKVFTNRLRFQMMR